MLQLTWISVTKLYGGISQSLSRDVNRTSNQVDIYGIYLYFMKVTGQEIYYI